MSDRRALLGLAVVLIFVILVALNAARLEAWFLGLHGVHP